ncbi:LmeA family phospholipid-binding protein [Parafrankia discariae]|uniref:LmeA family phospholipid-binding protein n=1 Tax=Parafrankia discariae TaxID=365528 RepID=UPI000377E548|nr:DUF2993 domain-containing protein [Parafrankia discariae]
MSPGGRRGLRIFLITMVVALVVVGVLDRVAARVVADQIATRAQNAENLAERPDVSLGGFPFLTQVVAGRYRDVELEVHGYEQDGTRVDRVHADLTGVRLPLSDVLRGEVERVPVDRVDAEVDLTFNDLNAYLASQNSQLKVSPAGQGIQIGGTVDLLGTPYPVSGTADIGVAPDAVTFTPRELAPDLEALIPPGLLDTVRSLLTVRVPVAGLPFNMKLRSATVRADRLTFAAGGENVLLDADIAPAVAPARTPGL